MGSCVRDVLGAGCCVCDLNINSLKITYIKNTEKKLIVTKMLGRWIICSALIAVGCLATQECGFPGSPSHSTVTLSDDGNAGSVATYSCERGFELLGPSRRVC